MEEKEVAGSLADLHKKVDTLTSMIEDLLTQIDDRRGEAVEKRKRMAATTRATRDMLLNMPGLNKNPMAQAMLKNMMTAVGVTEDEPQTGCGGCK